MVFAKGIEMNATNTVSEIYGFLLGVLIILIGAEESMLSRRLRNVSTVHVCRFYLEKFFFLVTAFIITVAKGDVCKHTKSMLNLYCMFLTVRGGLLINDW